MHSRPLIATVTLVALATTACGSLRGERTTVDLPPADLNYVDEGGAAGDDQTMAGEVPVIADRPAIAVSADDATATPFDFVATGLETGEEVLGRDLYERGLVLMEFSVPSCPVCHTEAPKLLDAARANPDITYVIVHSDDSETEIRNFVDQHRLRADNIIHLLDLDRSLWIRFGVSVQPYYVLVGADGTLSSSTGALGDHGLERAAEHIRSKA